MKYRFTAVSLLCAFLSVACFAQDATFQHIIGRNPNSKDFRAAFNAQRRNNLTNPKISSLNLGDDWQVSLGAGGEKLGQYPGIWPYTIGVNQPSCSDWAMFPINATPAVGGQANAVVYENLYRGGTSANPGFCGTGSPTVQTALALGSNPITSSIVMSFKGASRGNKFAVVEGANATLHFVTIGTDAGTTTAAVAADCVGTDSCDVPLAFTTITTAHCTPPATHSASTLLGLYVDYATDEGYIGDDAGRIYHITGVFNGTPTVDFCSGSIGGGAAIGEVIHINIAGTDYVYAISGGKGLIRMQVNATRTGFTGNTSLNTSGAANEVVDYLYDSDDNSIYLWTGRDTSAGTNHAALLQISAQTTPMVVVANLNLGPLTTVPYFMGAFDNNFWTNGPTSPNATGYTCVAPNGATGTTALASFQFTTGGVISGLTAMNKNLSMNPAAPNTGNSCTSLTADFDSTAGVDQLFVSAGNGTNTNNNKTSRYDITTPLVSNSVVPTVSSTVAIGGTSGVVIDNAISGLGNQTMNIYFADTAQPTTNRCGQNSVGQNNYCAVKLQQTSLN